MQSSILSVTWSSQSRFRGEFYEGRKTLGQKKSWNTVESLAKFWRQVVKKIPQPPWEKKEKAVQYVNNNMNFFYQT